MKFNSAIFSSVLIISLSQIAMSTNAWAVKQEKPERWFEIEVILFKQLGNKSAFKEQFPEGINASNLPNYRQSFDLLGSYVQPDLTGIKQFIPVCGEKTERSLFLGAQPSIIASISDKKFGEKFNQLQQLEQVATFSMPDFAEAPFSHSEKIIAKLNLQKETLTKPTFSTQKLCIIAQSEVESLFNEEELINFNTNSVSVDAIPSKLNAIGAHTSNNPYLIADESLLLKEISQRLRWSKEFEPLLHFGWRQVGITKKQAIPLRLIAGENIKHKYQQALTDYQIEIDEAKSIEQNLLEQLAIAQNTAQFSNQTQSLENETDKLNIKTEQKQQALNQLFSRINYTSNNPIDNDTLNNIINNIKEQSLESITSSDFMTSNAAEINIDDQPLGNDPLDTNTPPKKALQSWFLDGFFKVHLDHYLYITADFNVFNQNQVKTFIDDEKNDAKLINFSQNRRVITGEIHYFDHPYIGMVVQIRRFDPTKPVGEQVSQSIK